MSTSTATTTSTSK